MRVKGFQDRKILVDESEMTDKASEDENKERNIPDQESQEQPLTRNTFSSRRWLVMLRLSEKQQFIGKIQNEAAESILYGIGFALICLEFLKAITTLITFGIIVCITTASVIGFQMRNDSKTINDEKLCHYGSCSSNYDPKYVLPKQYWEGYPYGLMKDSPHVKKRNFPPGAFLPNETFPKIERIDSPDVKGSNYSSLIPCRYLEVFERVFGSLLSFEFRISIDFENIRIWKWNLQGSSGA